MKRLAVLLALALTLGSSCGATLRLRASAPINDNDGTCAAPLLVPAGSSALRVMHFAWSGPVAGEDSVSSTAGAVAILSRTVPPGTYTVRAWASDAGGAGCDTTAVVIVKAPPARVGLF